MHVLEQVQFVPSTVAQSRLARCVIIYVIVRDQPATF